jgi:pyrophosphatase PpaX
MVGDAPVDVRCGRAAGVRTAGALWGPFPRAALEEVRPDILLDSIDDLLAFGP